MFWIPRIVLLQFRNPFLIHMMCQALRDVGWEFLPSRVHEHVVMFHEISDYNMAEEVIII